jgi:hypothetical protein
VLCIVVWDCVLPPGDNLIEVNKIINNKKILGARKVTRSKTPSEDTQDKRAFLQPPCYTNLQKLPGPEFHYVCVSSKAVCPSRDAPQGKAAGINIGAVRLRDLHTQTHTALWTTAGHCFVTKVFEQEIRSRINYE